MSEDVEMIDDPSVVAAALKAKAKGKGKAKATDAMVVDDISPGYDEENLPW